MEESNVTFKFKEGDSDINCFTRNGSYLDLRISSKHQFEFEKLLNDKNFLLRIEENRIIIHQIKKVNEDFYLNSPVKIKKTTDKRYSIYRFSIDGPLTKLYKIVYEVVDIFRS